jgi:hypothetical protein
MIATFTALLFAHVLADFVLQTGWIHASKRRAGVLLLHGAIVLATTQAALGQVAAPEILLLALAHLGIDAIKTHGRFTGPGAFLTDQAAHLATLAALAVWAPGLWAAGLHATLLPAPAEALLLHAMALAAGLILTLRAGDFAIRALIEVHPPQAGATTPPQDGLPRGGRTIGHLERLLIFLLVLAGQFSAIGFLVAAKSILRFGTVSNDREATEYVIIGTLASFGWAIGMAMATQSLLALLPALAPLWPTS